MFREEYVSNKIHFGKRSCQNSEYGFASVFFFLGGEDFLFVFKQSMMLARKASLLRVEFMFQKRICFEQNSFWKLFPFVFIQSMNFARKAYFVGQVFLLRVEFMLWVEYMFREEYVSNKIHFGKRSCQNSEYGFYFRVFLWGEKRAFICFFKRSMTLAKKAFLVRQVFLLRVEFMLWVEYMLRVEFMFREEYFSNKIYFRKRSWIQSMVFASEFFLWGGRNGTLFVFSNVL